MTDAQMLMAVLAAVYVADCLVWLPRGSLAFTGPFGLGGAAWSGPVDFSIPAACTAPGMKPVLPRSRPIAPAAIAGNRTGGLALLDPFLPSVPGFICHPWPVSLSPDHAWNGISATPTPGIGRPESEEILLAWPEAGPVSANGRMIVTGTPPRPFARCADVYQAKSLAALMDMLAAEPARDARESAIRAAHAAAFDHADAAARVAEFRQAAGWHRRAATALFVTLFVAAPVVGAWRGPDDAIVAGGVLGLALSVACACAARPMAGQAARCAPAGVGQDLGTLVSMAVFPPNAIRGADPFARRVMSGLHPVAGTAALCDDANFLAVARVFWSDARHPVAAPNHGPEAEAADAWHRATLAEAIERTCSARGFAPGTPEPPPPVREEECAAYCPRCHVQVRAGKGLDGAGATTCRDCPGVGLISFPEAAG